MAERSQLRVSEGQDGRSERPATGRGQSRPTQGAASASKSGDPKKGPQKMPVLFPLSFPFLSRKRCLGGAAHAPRAGVANQRSQDGGAKSAPSERRPGWPQRTSGDGAWAVPTHSGRSFGLQIRGPQKRAKNACPFSAFFFFRFFSCFPPRANAPRKMPVLFSFSFLFFSAPLFPLFAFSAFFGRCLSFSLSLFPLLGRCLSFSLFFFSLFSLLSGNAASEGAAHAPRAGVADQRSQGWRSEVSSE